MKIAPLRGVKVRDTLAPRSCMLIDPDADQITLTRSMPTYGATVSSIEEHDPASHLFSEHLEGPQMHSASPNLMEIGATIGDQTGTTETTEEQQETSTSSSDEEASDDEVPFVRHQPLRNTKAARYYESVAAESKYTRSLGAKATLELRSQQCASDGLTDRRSEDGQLSNDDKSQNSPPPAVERDDNQSTSARPEDRKLPYDGCECHPGYYNEKYWPWKDCLLDVLGPCQRRCPYCGREFDRSSTVRAHLRDPEHKGLSGITVKKGRKGRGGLPQSHPAYQYTVPKQSQQEERHGTCEGDIYDGPDSSSEDLPADRTATTSRKRTCGVKRLPAAKRQMVVRLKVAYTTKPRQASISSDRGEEDVFDNIVVMGSHDRQGSIASGATTAGSPIGPDVQRPEANQPGSMAPPPRPINLRAQSMPPAIDATRQTAQQPFEPLNDVLNKGSTVAAPLPSSAPGVDGGPAPCEGSEGILHQTDHGASDIPTQSSGQGTPEAANDPPSSRVEARLRVDVMVKGGKERGSVRFIEINESSSFNSILQEEDDVDASRVQRIILQRECENEVFVLRKGATERMHQRTMKNALKAFDEAHRGCDLATDSCEIDVVVVRS